MTWIITGLLGVILAYLALEQRRALRSRKQLQHVIHVNGIRGKSTVTRLIDAGLRAGGGKDAFYTGEIAQAIVDEVASYGAFCPWRIWLPTSPLSASLSRAPAAAIRSSPTSSPTA